MIWKQVTRETTVFTNYSELFQVVKTTVGWGNTSVSLWRLFLNVSSLSVVVRKRNQMLEAVKMKVEKKKKI